MVLGKTPSRQRIEDPVVISREQDAQLLQIGQLTITIRVLTMPSKNVHHISPPCGIMVARRNSSRTKGTAKMLANGQPIVAPMPNHIIPVAVLVPPCQSMKAASPREDVYIAKLEGKKAIEA